MKRKITCMVMAAILIFSLTACGQESPANSVYDELIGQIYHEIADETIMDSEKEGMFSIYAGLGHLSTSEMLAAAGYAVEDINGDGTEELIIGMIEEYDGEQPVGDIIYNLYTVSEGKPVLVFDGFVRNSYSFIGDGKFLYHGSSSAASSAAGIFNLPAGATSLECEEFWFSEIKPGTETEIGYYYNTTGSWIPEESEELVISDEEFWDMEGNLIDQIKNIKYTSFADYN